MLHDRVVNIVDTLIVRVVRKVVTVVRALVMKAPRRRRRYVRIRLRSSANTDDPHITFPRLGDHG